MVSTRQMAITTTGPGSNEDCFQSPMATSHSSGRSPHHHSQATSAGSSSSNTSVPVPMVIASSALTLVTPNQVAPGQQIFIQDLPNEILYKIFSYMEFKKVAQARRVSQKFNQVCSSILNSTFQKLQSQMLIRFQNVKAKMPRRESARRLHPLACECDILETIYMRLQLLQMTFGKHIERKYCCFFPGTILDEVYSVLNYIRTTPTLARPYKVTDELFDLSTMAMEYFKEQLEPNLPDIYFSKDFIDYQASNSPSYMADPPALRESTSSPPPQSNMVLRKGIRKIKQGMKRYNNQLSVLRSELRTCKRKATEQAKQIAEQQKLLAEQQKQTVEYANRLDENDKKNEEIARKFSTLLQELNKCKTELQYWRSKSPATPVCQTCGQVIIPVPPEDIRVLVNQGLRPEDMGLRTTAAIYDDDDPMNNGAPVPAPTFLLFDDQPLSPISIGTSMSVTQPAAIQSGAATGADLVAPLPKPGNKRKAEPEPSSSNSTTGSAFVTATNAGNTAGEASSSHSGTINDNGTGSNGFDLKSDNISTASNNKKIRRVQTKVKFAPTTSNSKSLRNK